MGVGWKTIIDKTTWVETFSNVILFIFLNVGVKNNMEKYPS
jgi:hypothetical protein